MGLDIVGGFRIGPSISFFKQWENKKWIYTNASVNVGFKNKDVTGDYWGRYRYNPKRLASVTFSIGRDFEAINNYDAFLNMLRNSNYFLNDYIGGGHRFEVFNGFYLSTRFRFNDRQPTTDYETDNFIGDIIDDEDPIDFDPYQASVSNIQVSYTPKQRFMSEPDRKLVLGSKWPTFSLRHEKGWNKIFSSDVDYDFLDFTVTQDLIFGVLGNSKYRVQAGQFVNTKDLKYIDYKRFRESENWWYSDPLHSFQLLDTSLAITKFFVEAHHIHHFNGALINNIPLVRALRVHVVVGGGILWVKENKLRHEEIFAGLERTFKLGPRRRLRLGAYGVVANSSVNSPQVGYKFSIDIIDTWSRNWRF